MRHAYALLGLTFIIVFGSAYALYQYAEAPVDLTRAKPDVPLHTLPMDAQLTLTSSAFSPNETIPAVYTCDGENVPPPLVISGVPAGTVSFVLVMDDPDIPAEIKAARGIEKFDHWALYNIPADTTLITADTPASGGVNSAGGFDYRGPCPPPEYEPTTHRYVFRLYALSGSLNFIKEPTLDELEMAAQGMALGQATLVGLYDRTK